MLVSLAELFMLAPHNGWFIIVLFFAVVPAAIVFAASYLSVWAAVSRNWLKSRLLAFAVAAVIPTVLVVVFFSLHDLAGMHGFHATPFWSWWDEFCFRIGERIPYGLGFLPGGVIGAIFLMGKRSPSELGR
jgi:hypothetical protein